MSPDNLERYRQVLVADVYKAGRLAASLRRVDDGIEFAYDDGYLDAGGRPVATTLSMGVAPVTTTSGAVPAFFAGLLPEGRRLTSLRRAVKTSADDELSLLLAVGRDTIGDVQVVAADEDLSAVDPVVQVAGDWSEIRFADIFDEAGVIDPVGLPGVQDKVSARMLGVPVGRAGDRYLLKVDPPEFTHVVEDEAFFLDLAHQVHIDAASASVVHDADGRSGLLVRRFDRITGEAGALQSLACEDACQVLGRWPADKYNVTCEEAVRALADRCAARAVALRALFGQLCFAWLTGNGDVHAKNLSILATPNGEWRVAPAYDLPSTVPYGDKTLALSVGGRTSGLSRRRLVEFAADIGLPDRVAVKVLDALLVRLEGLEEALSEGALPFTPSVTIDLMKELRFRRRQATG